MITIHCGLHKTGSTAIQFALATVARRKKRQIYVPTPGLDRGEHAWSTRLKGLLSYPQAVLSDETLLGNPYDGYALAQKRAHLISQVLSGCESQIVVYLRPQYSWLPSVFTQALQEGLNPDLDHFLAVTNGSPWLLWSNLVKLLREVSGVSRVVPRIYSSNMDVVGDFFEVAGLGKAPFFGKVGVRANVSIPAVQIPILTALLRAPEFRGLDTQQLRVLFQEVLAPGAATGFSPFSASQQIQISERYREDWKVLAHAVSDEFPLEARQMIAVFDSWPQTPMPHLDGGLENPATLHELIRCLGVLALSRDGKSKSSVVAALRKFGRSPRSAPEQLGRAIRRVSAR